MSKGAPGGRWHGDGPGRFPAPPQAPKRAPLRTPAAGGILDFVTGAVGQELATTPAARPARADGLPARRVVLLGASNVTGAIATILETALRFWEGPLDVLAALGNGRSYGLRKAWLGRELPGITSCGLWETWERRLPAPTAALVTDIGNDLLYEVPVPEILGWVEACVDRLQRADARVVLTALPLCNVAHVSPRTFTLIRSACFPRCRLGFAALVDRAQELDRQLRQLARARGLLLAEHRPEWYGLDPFHIRARHWPAAWREILSPWSRQTPVPAVPPASFRNRLYLRLLAPERRWLFGWEQRRPQPAGRLPDGTTVALY